MAQIFHPSMNVIAKASLGGVGLLVVVLGWVGYSVQGSPYMTNQMIAKDQPVPFSHEHHVKGLGIDCRYCHTSVEDSHFAGIPPTETCMSCHSKVWTNAAILAPVRKSWQENRPISGADGEVGWTRVHNVPDFVYFNHSIHINKGIGCTSCHGKVDEMPLMYQENTLQMGWCLDCHRAPEKNVRPREEVFSMDYNIKTSKYVADEDRDQDKLGPKLVAKYHIASPGHLVTCYVCHR